eukprot:CAMPEP_0174855886 /NCGR_PEP_ID=MMETSP1114-20130205/34510_1 /TAXON_ID=312471 /ORGANISM="Neobodo designis, Strain CCAP 1951/1" /LENGTH=79 /DNA_ID=CAMNT_0016090659 /DNA_START=32 /DNA_END=267 /DNA_ORIENTATION=+
MAPLRTDVALQRGHARIDPAHRLLCVLDSFWLTLHAARAICELAAFTRASHYDDDAVGHPISVNRGAVGVGSEGGGVKL